MTDERPSESEAEPTGEEAPDRSNEQVAGKAGDHEFPTMGRGGDMTADDESLARRPAQEEDEAKSDPEAGSPAPGSTTPGT